MVGTFGRPTTCILWFNVTSLIPSRTLCSCTIFSRFLPSCFLSPLNHLLQRQQIAPTPTKTDKQRGSKMFTVSNGQNKYTGLPHLPPVGCCCCLVTIGDCLYVRQYGNSYVAKYRKGNPITSHLPEVSAAKLTTCLVVRCLQQQKYNFESIVSRWVLRQVNLGRICSQNIK